MAIFPDNLKFDDFYGYGHEQEMHWIVLKIGQKNRDTLKNDSIQNIS